MGIRTAQSQAETVDVTLQDLRSQLGPATPSLVLYFASSRFDPAALSAGMQAAFAPATVIGCTTAGEIGAGAMLKGAIVAMAFDADTVPEAHVQVLEGLSGDDPMPAAFGAFEAQTGVGMRDLDVDKYVGLILVDGLSGAEERLMDSIGDRTDVTFIGGSAGDDLAFKTTYVLAQGRAYTNAALLALLRVPRGVDVIKTQSFTPSDTVLVATDVREATREVLAFNGRPAAAVYAEALNVAPDSLPGEFMSHPMGLMDGADPFVRSPQQVVDGGVRFYCAVREGMELTVLTATDMVEDTRVALADAGARGAVQGIVNFHCILRTLDLERRGQTEAYGELFARLPAIGFSTYGEEYIGHINQTATMLVFR
ncbi:MAG: FIST C-terminal domain-containing protein [Chloroflexota bacterium]|nr:FIST C-terminal domain-containing protein [Chloroflexota bacterium]